MQRVYLLPEMYNNPKSKFYMRDKTNVGEVRVTKPADPELLKKNKKIIEQWNKRAERRRHKMQFQPEETN